MYLYSSLLCLEKQKALDELCDEYIDILSLQPSNIDDIKLFTTDIDT